MRFIAGLSAVLFCSAYAVQAQNIAGTWTGAIHANKDLRLELRIQAKGNAEWTASLISLDQTDKAIPVDTVWVKGQQMIFTVRQIGSSFEGSINPAGDSISGYWLQGVALPLTFTKKQ